MADKAKRTGKNKREQQQRLGGPKPPDERKVKSPQTAADFLTQSGRVGLATGYTLRVDAEDDLVASPLIQAACVEHGRRLAERTLTQMLVAGAAMVAKELEAIVTHSAADAEDDGEMPAELVVAAAAKFASVRRKAIARMSKGEKNRMLRHSFGISVPMNHGNLGEVRAGMVALLAGRAKHPGSPAARIITDGDVEKGRTLVQQLSEIQSRQGAQRSSAADTARQRDVLHCALEIFYDRFGAAVDVALEDDDATRVALLSLIPRRRDRRTAAQKPPVQMPLAATK
jgi:hypothetical protein